MNSGKPGTYIISTNTLISIREIVETIIKIYDIKENLIIEYDSNLLKRKRKDIKGNNAKLEKIINKKPKVFKKISIGNIM